MLSFSDGVITNEGDVFEIRAAPFTLPVSNSLSRAGPVGGRTAVTVL